MTTGTRYWLVVPAAGASRRFGSELAKPFAALAGRTVLDRSLQLFSDDAHCLGIALVVSAAALTDEELRARLSSKVRAVQGGLRRCDSVLAGLAALAAHAGAQEWVLVHDAARPCLSAGDLGRLLEAGSQHPTGALLATPVTDTLKRADKADRIECTVDRSSLWQALTPQMFRYGPLCEALRAAMADGREPTDEAQAMEWHGARALLVAAQDSNIKITTAKDLALAAAILAVRCGTGAAGCER